MPKNKYFGSRNQPIHSESQTSVYTEKCFKILKLDRRDEMRMSKVKGAFSSKGDLLLVFCLYISLTSLITIDLTSHQKP